MGSSPDAARPLLGGVEAGNAERHPFPSGFPWRSPDLAVTYHLAYHWTLALHVNHMVLLHVYMLGVFFTACAFSADLPGKGATGTVDASYGVPPALAAVAAAFATTDLFLVRSRPRLLVFAGVHILTFVAPLASAAYLLASSMNPYFGHGGMLENTASSEAIPRVW